MAVVAAASAAVPVAWALPWAASALEDASSGFIGFAGFVSRGLADPAVQALLAAMTGASAFAVAWFSRRMAAAGDCPLRWDGREWLLPADGRGRAERRGEATLMLDLGSWMLVRFRPHAAGPGRRGATWLPLHATRDRARWTALRGALWNGRGHSS